MGFKIKSAGAGALVGGALMGPLGIAAGALAGGRTNLSGGGGQEDPSVAEKNRLNRLLSNEDDLQYIDEADKSRFKGFYDQSVAPQDAFGFYKSKADELEALITNRKERSKVFMEQVKLLASKPGSAQLRNIEIPLLAAGKSAQGGNVLSPSALGASQQGGILGR